MMKKADEDYEEIKCFCFSPILDQPAGVILKNGTLSYASLQQSFFKAQANDTALINNPS